MIEQKKRPSLENNFVVMKVGNNRIFQSRPNGVSPVYEIVYMIEMVSKIIFNRTREEARF